MTRRPATPPPVAVVGAAGRLGVAVVAACRDRGYPVVAVGRSDGWVVRDRPWAVVDASGPGALAETIDRCSAYGAGLIYAVSQRPKPALADLRRLSAEVPVVVATNLSAGHWIQLAVLRLVAGLTTPQAPDRRLTVLERHPATKAHRPSASAVELGARWTAVAGGAAPEVVSVRSGHPVSDHEFTLDLPGESVTVRHAVADLAAAATGALAAVDFVAAAAPGLWGMADVYAATWAKDDCDE